MIVDLNLTEEQRLILDSLGTLLAEHLPVERLRDPATHGGARERAVMRDLADFGLFGIGLPERDGGLDLSLAEEVLCAQMLGRHLVSPLCLAQMVAPHLADDPDRRRALVSATARAALANRVDGASAHLLDGEGADHWLLFGDSAALVPAGEQAVPVPFMDETLDVVRQAIPPATVPRGPATDRLSLLVSAYLVGLSTIALDMAVEHAKTREQFGQPIGAFQAVKHQCADMAMRSTAAEAQVRFAATLFGHGGGDSVEASAARLIATSAAIGNAKAAIQIHGAMGFTAECDAHLVLKRAHVMTLLGAPRNVEHRRLVDKP